MDWMNQDVQLQWANLRWSLLLLVAGEIEDKELKKSYLLSE